MSKSESRKSQGSKMRFHHKIELLLVAISLFCFAVVLYAAVNANDNGMFIPSASALAVFSYCFYVSGGLLTIMLALNRWYSEVLAMGIPIALGAMTILALFLYNPVVSYTIDLYPILAFVFFVGFPTTVWCWRHREELPHKVGQRPGPYDHKVLTKEHLRRREHSKSKAKTAAKPPYSGPCFGTAKRRS